ncbi:MAG: hypothetical protein ABFS24_01760 [Pseudomonadota bacterium]
MKNGLLLLLLVFNVLPACAERLDDSLSTQQQFDLDLDWKQTRNTENLDERELNALTARARRVEIRLNTRRFVGKRGKIFIRLPINIRGTGDSSALRMSWQTNGLFSNGAITAGNRAKLFEGEITEPVMSDVFDITFDIDARQVYNNLRFQPLFDIETF